MTSLSIIFAEYTPEQGHQNIEASHMVILTRALDISLGEYYLRPINWLIARSFGLEVNLGGTMWSGAPPCLLLSYTRLAAYYQPKACMI